MDRTYVSLDLETTGFDPYADDIIEIGAVKFCGDTVLGTYHSLARPLEPLPYRIQILTGITDQDLENAPPSGIALSDLVSFLEDLPIVGHSISFDLSFLSQKGIELANAAYDTWELATILLPTLSDYSLSGVADELGVAYSVRHRALADATVAKDVFLRLLDTGRGLDSSVVAEMVQMAEGTDWAPAHVFRQLSEEKMGRTPSWPTGSTAGVEANGGAEQLVPVRPRELLDAGAVADMLGPQGLMARSLEGFDHRPEQVQMLTAVADAFNESDHLMVEAGTGTGKSIAYLLPASLFAVKNGVRVVISTNTINLQEQLVNKDIPQLARALQGESMPVPRYAQLKGRNNYLCQRRWSLLRRSRPVSAEEVKTVARILVWAASTQSGDRAELSLRGEEQFVWNRVRAQADSCLGAHCPYHKRGECFLYRARRKAEKAHLIVINHALLLSDIASTARARIIPEYSHVIIDEAHHVEDVATEQWGFEVDQQHLEQYLNRVWERVGEGGYGGLLSEVLAQSKAGSVAPAVGEQVQSMVGEAAGWVEECRGRAGSFFNTVRHFVDAHAEDAGYYERRLRLSKAVRTQPGWFDVELSWEKLGAALLEVEAG
ncbi:MAG: exonuclease domain-containing protein, partial [Chloroflexota bacterium]